MQTYTESVFRADFLMLKCPECGLTQIVKNGVRVLSNGSDIQLFRCGNCGRNFSENYIRVDRQKKDHQLCAILKEAKKLDTVTETKTVTCDMKGRILEYCFKMSRDGYAETTIRLTNTALRVLMDRGGDLNNPESVKEVMGRQNWSGNRKRNVINAYTKFLKFLGLTWSPPKYTITRKIPFIPTEQEIDDLIAGCPNTVATFLQLLKETAMRSGEAKRLKWKDVDFQRKTITLNEPEKGSNPRIFNSLSAKLLNMLNALPRTSDCIFTESSLNSLKTTYSRARKRLAYKLGNTRLNEIHFHTLRHWKATMEYHYTKDILHVKQLLGHKEIDNTMIYIHLDKQLFQNIPEDNFIIRTAHTLEEAVKLGEVGFEPFVIIDGVQLFRKRK
jgi:integrase